MTLVHLDQTNLRLLELLQKNGRASVSDLAKQLNRGESTIRERLASLERGGIIRGYRAVLDLSRVGFPVRAVVRASCDPRQLPQVAARLATIPNVVAANHITGRHPLRIELLAEDIPALERVVAQRLAPLELGDMEVGIVMETLVERRDSPLVGVPPFLERAPVPLPERNGNGGNGRSVAVDPSFMPA